MKKWRIIKKIILVFMLLVFLVGFGGGVAFLEFRSYLLPAEKESREIVVEIPPGTGAVRIGELLEEKGVIRSAKAFRYLVAYRKVGGKLKAGEHVLDPSWNAEEVIRNLIKGNFKLYRLTIPEGLNMTQVAKTAAETGMVDEKEFLKLCHDKDFIKSLGLDTDTLEGYLFPETYHFPKSADTRKIVTAMVERFKEVWKKYEARAKDHKLSQHEIVTLASIVEKETGADQERPMIAGVFLNRLKKGMRLETDPTVIYGIKDFDGNITRKHLETPTPYNTYIIEGLPPGPIANPGEDSLKAVFEPAQVEYVFFVSKNDGTHYFSRTLKEHNQAVNFFQRGKGREPKQK